jgi:hypothetical protein
MPFSRLLCLTAAALFLAASPFAAHGADACNLLSTGQIASVTSDAVTHTGPGDCIWSGSKSRVYITTRDGSGWANAKSMFLSTGHATSVSGVGDDAFFMGSDQSPTFYVLKGAHYIILRVNVTNFSADQTKAALKALAASAVTGL